MKNFIPSIVPRWIVLLFFWIGLTAAVCIRSLAVVSRVHPEAALWVWRFAMGCYLFFFGYRFWIGQRRRNVVIRMKMVEQFEANAELDPELRSATLYILRSITRSKELFNYALIFLLSLAALLLDLLVG